MCFGNRTHMQVKSLTEKRPVLGRCFRLLDSPSLAFENLISIIFIHVGHSAFAGILFGEIRRSFAIPINRDGPAALAGTGKGRIRRVLSSHHRGHRPVPAGPR